MIRKATENDIEDILSLGRMMHAESRYSRFDYSESKYRTLVTHIIDNGIALVAEIDGKIAGVFLGFIRDHFFGHDLQSGDFVQYVVPEHRGGMTGVRLIKEYVKAAKEAGVKDIGIGITTGISVQRVGELYGRIGFDLVGYNYSMRV